MQLLINILASMIMDVEPEADNAYEALDKYCRRLYKRIRLKDNSGIDYQSDLELYLFLNGYKSKIVEIVHKQEIKERRL